MVARLRWAGAHNYYFQCLSNQTPTARLRREVRPVYMNRDDKPKTTHQNNDTSDSTLRNHNHNHKKNQIEDIRRHLTKLRDAVQQYDKQINMKS